MNWLDWLALSIGVITLVGGTFDGNDFEREVHRPSAAQLAAPAQATAGLVVGGETLMRFTDSGVMAAEERAREARMNLRRAVVEYGLPGGYLGLGLRVAHGSDVAEVCYLDMRLATVTARDAKAAGASSANALADRWREGLDKAIRGLPQPLPDGWIVDAGKPRGAVLVSDDTLARAAAASLSAAPGRRVRVSAAGGVLILEGEVASGQDRARLERLMRELPGVRGVDNRLGVAR